MHLLTLIFFSFFSKKAEHDLCMMGLRSPGLCFPHLKDIHLFLVFFMADHTGWKVLLLCVNIHCGEITQGGDLNILCGKGSTGMHVMQENEGQRGRFFCFFYPMLFVLLQEWQWVFVVVPTNSGWFVTRFGPSHV